MHVVFSKFDNKSISILHIQSTNVDLDQSTSLILSIWFSLSILIFEIVLIKFLSHSVKGTIDRYKKAYSDQSGAGSVAEANAQVLV